MTLPRLNIKCPECGVDVVGPDEGGIEMQCGSCGKLFLTPTPIAKPVDLSPHPHSPNPFSPVNHTTIELTSKRLKLYEIGCLLIMLLVKEKKVADTLFLSSINILEEISIAFFQSSKITD